jgi:hypothetical protein
VADILQDTYYVYTGAARSPSTAGSSGASFTSTQTDVGTHDASAATKDGLHLTPPGYGDPWDSFGSVDWGQLERAGIYAGTISFIRFVFKVKRTTTVGTNTYLVQSRWNNANRGPGTTSIPAGSASVVYEYFTTDEASTAWTHAKLIAQSFGYRLRGLGDDDSDGDNPTLDCEEFKIEAWGPEPTPQTTYIGAAAVGEAGAVGSDPPAATSTVISASAASGAGSSAVSVAFNPPLSVELYSSDAIPAPTNSFTGVPLPFGQAMAKIGQKTLRSLGKPHFAFALLAPVECFYAGDEYAAYVTFSISKLPDAQSSVDEPHWLFSLHETTAGGVELLSVGVTPSGRFACSTRENGLTLSAAGVVPADGLFHQIHLKTWATLGERRLYLDGVCILDVIGPLAEIGGYGAGGSLRFTLFNGRDGASVLSCSIANAVFSSRARHWDGSIHDYTLEWPINEGSGGILTGTGILMLVGTTMELEATWFNGGILSSCPEFPALPLASAYTWGRSSAWTPRRPVQPEYRKVVSL